MRVWSGRSDPAVRVLGDATGNLAAARRVTDGRGLVQVEVVWSEVV